MEWWIQGSLARYVQRADSGRRRVVPRSNEFIVRCRGCCWCLGQCSGIVVGAQRVDWW